MSKRQRSSTFLLRDKQPDLVIWVDGCTDPPVAHYDVLQLFSECVKDLPKSNDAGPTVWDLRSLVLEGDSEPVKAVVVRQWLDLIYSHVDTSRRLTPLTTFEEAKPLLLFADASMSCDTILEELGRMLTEDAECRLVVRVGEEVAARLMLQGRLYSKKSGDLWYSPVPCDEEESLDETVCKPVDVAFSAALVAELEQWLYLAGRLQLTSLLRYLMGFVKSQLVSGNSSILVPKTSGIYSPRVLQSMPREILLEGFLRDSLLYQPSHLTLSGRKISGETTSHPGALNFFPEPLEEVAAFDLVQEYERTYLSAPGRTGIPMNVTLGGLDADQCSCIVQKALSAALDNA